MGPFQLLSGADYMGQLRRSYSRRIFLHYYCNLRYCVPPAENNMHPIRCVRIFNTPMFTGCGCLGLLGCNDCIFLCRVVLFVSTLAK